MSDEVELIKNLGARFIQRRDVKAVQKTNGEWFPVRDRDTGEELPFKMQDFKDHLAGKTTYGHYLLDKEGLTKLFAFDIDLVKGVRKLDNSGYDPIYVDNLVGDREAEPGWLCFPREEWLKPDSPALPSITMSLRFLAEGLAHTIWRLYEGAFHVAIADSGSKGLHVYGLLPEPMPAAAAKEFALGVLRYYGKAFEATKGDNFYKHTMFYPYIEIEVFPKQANLDGKEFGNLMSLPLGVNQKTGRPKRFLSMNSSYTTLRAADPLDILTGDLPWD